MSLGFSADTHNYLKIWREIWRSINRTALLPLPAPKLFKAKHNLYVLKNYSQPAPPGFWRKFPVNLLQPGISLINHDKLKSLAIECGYPNLGLLEVIYKDIKFGADIGCRGQFRNPSTATNAMSAITDGEKVTDAIADWVKKGFAYGPIPLYEVPASAKFSGIMTTPKPNGSVRVILNLSAPLGSAVNEGINNDDFPATMSSTTKWLRIMNRAGRYCKLCKIDWADAYKHIAVRQEDTDLQWFKWLGMAFKELCLIFW